MTLPPKPTATPHNQTGITPGTSIPLSTLFTYSSAAGDTVLGFDFKETTNQGGYITDNNGTALTPGVLYGSAGTGIPISELSQYHFAAGPSGTSDSVNFNVEDQYNQISTVVSATVRAATTTPAAPTATPHNQTSITPGTSIPLSTLFTYSSAAGDTVLGFDFKETTNQGGYITDNNGTALTPGVLYGSAGTGIPISELSQYHFVAGPSGTSDSVNFNVEDQYNQISTVVSATVRAATTTPAAPTATPHNQTSITPGTSIPLSTLFTYSSAAGDTVLGFDFKETTNQGGYITDNNGTALTPGVLYGSAGTGIPISELSQYHFVAGPSGTSDSVNFNVEDQYNQISTVVSATVSAAGAGAGQQGIDALAANRLTQAQIQNANKQFVAEYIGSPYPGAYKYLDPDYAKTLLSNHISIVSVFERHILYDANSNPIDPDPTDISTYNVAQADSDAAYALSGAKTAGQAGGAIYFAVDADPGPQGSSTEIANLASVVAYFREIQSYFSTHGSSYSIGVYGAGDVLKAVKLKDNTQYTWLAYAPSWAGSDYSAESIEQTINSTNSNPILIGNVAVDLDLALATDIGAWGSGGQLPTFSVSNDPNATRGQPVNLGNLVTISDPSSVGYQTLELWDSNGTVAGGQFVVNSVAQSGGHEIDVSPANVANTVFDAGTLGGTDTLWARLLQDNGQLSSWQQFTVTAPAATLPTVTVSNDPNATRGQPVNLGNLVTISDPSSVGYQTLELWDSNGTVAGGQFVVNGVAQSGGHEIDVSPANVANTVFDVGTLGGTDTLWARLLQNNGQLTSWQQFTVTAPAATLPTVTVSNDPNATRGQPVNLGNLVTISDPSSVGYQTLELWDSNGTVVGGQFVVNSVAQTGGHEIDVSPANVANTVFDAGTSGGTDTLWARLLQDDGTLTPWQSFTVTVPTPTLNVNNIANATGGQLINLSGLVTVSDPGNVGYQQLELWDSQGTVSGGQFVVNATPQTGGHEIDVSPANVANTVFDVGAVGGTDTLWARLLQNNGQLTGWQQFTVTAPVDTGPVVGSVTSLQATQGQTFSASSLFTASDPLGDPIQQYDLWDSGWGGGHFVLNGQALTISQDNIISASQLAQVTYVGGNGLDALRVRANEGGQWSSWSGSFTVGPPAFTVQLNDPNNLAQDAALVTDMNAAAADWWQHLKTLGTVDIQINVQSTTRANGGPGTVVFTGPDGARSVYESGALYEMLTGNHPSGSPTDVVITIDPSYLQNDLWLDPNPSQPSAIPSDRVDAVSVLRHELGHGFGIITDRDPSTGALPAGYEMTWDQLVQIRSDGSAWFTGSNAEAVYGGPVPVTTLQNGEQYAHLGNSVSDADGQDLMNGVGFRFGTSYQISSLDLAILMDLGAPITSTFAQAGLQNISGVSDALTLASSSISPSPEAIVNYATNADNIEGSGALDRTIGLLINGMASISSGQGHEFGVSAPADSIAAPSGQVPLLTTPAANQGWHA